MPRRQWFILIASIATVSLLIIMCIARVRSSAYYRFHRLQVGMSRPEARAILGELRPGSIDVNLARARETYATTEGTLVLQWDCGWFAGYAQETLTEKSFLKHESSESRFICWLIDLGFPYSP